MKRNTQKRMVRSSKLRTQKKKNKKTICAVNSPDKHHKTCLPICFASDYANYTSKKNVAVNG